MGPNGFESYFSHKQWSKHRQMKMAMLDCAIVGITTECTIVLICQDMTSKKQQQNEAKSLLRGHCPLCVTRCFIGALVMRWAPSDHMWSRPKQANRLPGALLPEAALTKLNGRPHVASKSITLPIKPWKTKLSNSGVPPSECNAFNPLSPIDSKWSHRDYEATET